VKVKRFWKEKSTIRNNTSSADHRSSHSKQLDNQTPSCSRFLDKAAQYGGGALNKDTPDPMQRRPFSSLISHPINYACDKNDNARKSDARSVTSATSISSACSLRPALTSPSSQVEARSPEQWYQLYMQQHLHRSESRCGSGSKLSANVKGHEHHHRAIANVNNDVNCAGITDFNVNNSVSRHSSISSRMPPAIPPVVSSTRILEGSRSRSALSFYLSQRIAKGEKQIKQSQGINGVGGGIIKNSSSANANLSIDDSGSHGADHSNIFSNPLNGTNAVSALSSASDLADASLTSPTPIRHAQSWLHHHQQQQQ
jgi:hypothetical protein